MKTKPINHLRILSKSTNFDENNFMKFGIIKERKNPPDRRVVFSPLKLQEFQQQFPAATILVESSDIRIFSDDAYLKAGFEAVSYTHLTLPTTPYV